MKIFLFFIFSIFLLNSSSADEFNQILNEQEYAAKQYLMANISPSDAVPGTVIASPSRQGPDYYFHWVRDAALVMQVVLNLYEEEQDPVIKSFYLQRLDDFVDLTHLQQTNSGFQSYGEPKYFVDGRPYDGPWGRPQNDGPALRASVLMRYASVIVQNGQSLSQKLINVIKNDLEYTIQFWRDPNFDLWEEVYGDHFYTRFAQRKALLDCQLWANENNFKNLAQSCTREVNQLNISLNEFKDYDQEILKTTINRVGGLDYKYSNLDTANVLAVLHSYNHDGEFSPASSWVINTAKALDDKFKVLYPINSQYSHFGTAIGRYPEDQYYGGNPWFLTTFAMAELYYKLAIEFHSQDYFQIADNYMKRGLFHRGHGGSIAEQMNKYTGFMESARDLTWSYASFLTAMKARRAAVK
ncbi:MAG: glycoside hydrolase family 15 protein [Bdellovibrionales bacterium]|nr:glycoside hydrolase family 15 protein [Bdellovibrionales bacterium]